MAENKGVAPVPVSAGSGLTHDAEAGDLDAMTTPPTSKRTPAFQFYPSDFLGSSKVSRMSLTERGAYITLLSFCWLDGGLTTDTKTLAAMLHVKAIQFDRMWSGPLHECFYEKNGKLQNARLDRERKKQTEFSKKQSDNGKLGGRPKKPNANPEEATANSGLSQTEPKKSSLSPSPSSSPFPSSEKTQTARPRSTSIFQRRRLDAAWEGGRVYVPQRLHADLLGIRGGEEVQLFAWYGDVDREYAGEIDPDMFVFWRARYREKWPPTAETKADTRVPQWAR